MRIISPFKDYYDAGQAGAHDDPLVYVRRTETYEKAWRGKDVPAVVQGLSNLVGRTVNPCNEDTCGVKVVLAGKLYIGYKFSHRDDEGHLNGKFSYAWSFQQLKTLGWTPKRRSHERHLPDRWEEKREEEVEAGFQVPAWTTANVAAYCVEHQIALFSEETDRYEVNPCLRPLEFVKAMNPQQVFQELSMFLGNLASKDDTPIKIADKDRIAQHGFDKMSFRKEPTKRR